MAASTYVYSVIKRDAVDTGRRARATRGPRAPKGMPGAGPARLLPAGDAYALAVASVPSARYSSETIEKKLRDLDWVAECGAAHEGVVEWSATQGTVVPMKLFTIFTSDDRAVDHV